MDRFTLTVLGADGYIGSEVSRLGVAIGCDVHGLTRGAEPEHVEPWMHGVQWSPPGSASPGQSYACFEGSDAVVCAITPDAAHLDALKEALRAAHKHDVGKFVYLSLDPHAPWSPEHTSIALEAQALTQAHPLPWAILRAGLAWDDERRPLKLAASHHGIPEARAHELAPVRMELVAMAALRAAMQPQTTGVLSPDEVAYLGDAMMIQ